eukprot:5689930-Amphidinium_carterae.3
MASDVFCRQRVCNGKHALGLATWESVTVPLTSISLTHYNSTVDMPGALIACEDQRLPMEAVTLDIDSTFMDLWAPCLGCSVLDTWEAVSQPLKDDYVRILGFDACDSGVAGILIARRDHYLTAPAVTPDAYASLDDLETPVLRK